MRPQASLRIAIGGAAMLAIGMGIARFAYTPILPAMRADAGLSVLLGGYLATANYFGYLIGAIWTMFARRFGLKLTARTMLMVSLFAAYATTAAMATTENFLVWTLLRFISGIASAWLMIYASALVLDASAASNENAKLMLGVHYAGVGCGIVLSGLLVAVLESAGFAWSRLWLAESALILVLFPLAFGALRTPSTPAAERQAVPSSEHAANSSGIGWLIAAYFCAGLGYIVSATFLPSIAKQHPQLVSFASFGWILVGISAIPSNYLWSWILARIGHLPALIIAMGIQAVGVVLPVLSPSPPALLASAAILGGTFMGIVTIANAKARLAAPQRTAEIVAAMTAAYGVGQIIGPMIAGKFAEARGDFSTGLWIAAATLVVGVALLMIGAATTRRQPVTP